MLDQALELSPGPSLAPPAQAGPIPAILQDPASIEVRVQDLSQPLRQHFDNIRTLTRYSKQRKVNWFPKAQVNMPSVVLSHLRAVEKTAIAYLAGGKPNWKVSSYGGYQGEAQQDEKRGARDAKFERLARAIWHHIDRQSEQSLAYEPVERAIRQGEVIFQYGWIPEGQRAQGGPIPGLESPLMSSAADVASHAAPDKHRFPLFIRVLNRLKVFYELDPYGEPVEVYYKYMARASQVAEAYPDWRDADKYAPVDMVSVVEAYVGAFWALTINGDIAAPARPHHYGPRPPFVIQQCAPEDVSDDDLGVTGTSGLTAIEIRAGQPFALDAVNSFEEACTGASLKRAILENAAIGTLVIENSDASRFTEDGDNDEGEGRLMLGPGVALFLKGNEKLARPPVAELPPALASYLQSSGEGMEILTFSSKLLSGDTGGDTSGYATEQVRQAAMARLLPYRDAIARSWSRLFEKLFILLANNWAAEWGDAVTLTGQQEGEYFAETMTPQDLNPPPDSVEMSLLPAVPQNKIAEEAARNASVQAGTMDPLVALEERGSPNPQDEWDSILVHKLQLNDPAVLASTVQRIIEARAQKAGIMLPQQGGPGGMAQAAMAPGGPGPGGVPPAGPLGPGSPPGGPLMPPGPAVPPPGSPQPPQGPPGASRPPFVRPGAPAGPMPGAPQPPQPPPSVSRLLSPDPRAVQPRNLPPLPPMPRRPGAPGPAPQQRPAGSPLGVQGAPAPPIPLIRRRKGAPGAR